MMRNILFITAFLLFAGALCAENASNVRVQQRNKDVVITYDLSKTSNVSIYVASGKSNDFIPLKAIEGDVGKHVKEGKNLQIVWHPLAEQEEFVADDVRFKVEALGSYEQYLLPKSRNKMLMGGTSNMETILTVDVGYSVAPQLSYGFSLGQTYSGIGWYVNARSNFNFASATNGWTCDSEGYIIPSGTIVSDRILPFYSGNTKSSTFVANAGFMLDLLEKCGGSPRNRFNAVSLYVGIGYGWRYTLWETTHGQWVEYSPTSYNGFSGNIGVMGSMYGLTVKIGVNTIQFKYLELEAGIGWMF